MADRKRLPGYEQQYAAQPNNGGLQQPVRLQRRKSHWVRNLIITLTVIVVVLGGLIGGGLLFGNYFCEQNLGVSLWTMFEVMGDLKQDDEDKIVTNAYNDNLNDPNNDINKFYANINGNLFLRPEAGTKQIVDNLMSGMISGDGASTEAMQDYVLSLFSAENIYKEKLENYIGWQEGADAKQYLEAYTDRQFGAFFNDMVFTALDNMMGEEMPFDIKLGDIAKVDQIIIAKGADIDDYYKAVDDHVYMTMTASLSMNSIIEKAAESAGFDAGSVMWLVNWLLPKKIFLTVTLDMSDADFSPVYEINHLDRYTCNYKAVGAGEAAEMTRQERLFSIINTIVEKTGNADSQDFSIENTMDEMMGNMKSFIVKDEHAAFSLGNFIDFGSVTKTSDGNSFKIDLLGSFMSMIGDSIDLESSDVIVLMQAVICPDTAAMLDSAPGVYVFGEESIKEKTVSQSSMTQHNDITVDDETNNGGNPLDDIDDETRKAFIEQYSDAFLAQLAADYGIVVIELDDNGDPVLDDDGNEIYLYTIDDLYGALGLSEEDPTDAALELKNKINDRVKEIKEDGNMPMINITDEMLCALMYSKLGGFDGELANYGISFEKLGIETNIEDDGIEHSYAKMYCTFDFDSLVGENETMAAMIKQLLGNRNMLFEITIDITVDDIENPITKKASSLIINGLNGDAGILNGLKTSDVTGILEKFSSFNIDTLFTDLDELIESALSSVNTSPLAGIHFVESTSI